MAARREVPKGNRQGPGWMTRNTFCAVLVACWTLLSFSAALAGPSIPGFYQANPLPQTAAHTLPSVRDIQQGVSAIVTQEDKSCQVVYQNQEKAVINWNSFNIGRGASVHFDQRKNPEWAVLNRIHDSSPSQIYGRLSADGKVYLLNRNGILFGPGSQVQVHSLLASALNLKDEDFLGNRLKLRLEDYGGETVQAAGKVAVSNHGTITAGDLGSVFLLAPNVENAGTITTAGGQIGLAAASEVELFADTSGSRASLVVDARGNLGEAANLTGGSLVANTGMIGLYGKNITQNGLIRAVTAIRKNGQIELHATDRVSTGAASVTECPISTSDEKVHESFAFTGGEIWIRGLDFVRPSNPQAAVGRIEHYGTIAAPSGTVTMEARDRIYLERGSLIDVSGTWIEKPASSLQLSTQLNSNELRDSYTQKYGVLSGATVTFNAVQGSKIGDVSGALTSQEKTALERSLAGGKIYLTVNDGDIISRAGSTLDFSGGGIRYAEGTSSITRLVSGNRVYDFGNAPEARQYDRILGYEKVYSRFGITDHYGGAYYGGAYAVADLSSAAVEGADAGQVKLAARFIQLDGTLDGTATRGYYQTQSEESRDKVGNQASRGLVEPKGGSLTLGLEATASSTEKRDFLLEAVELVADVPALPPDFSAADQPYEADSARKTLLSSQSLNQAGLGSLKILANTVFATAADSALSLNPGAQFAATARLIEHRGSIQTAGGDISLATRDNISGLERIGGQANTRYVPLLERIYLAEGSVLSSSGERVDSLLGNLGVEHPAGTGHLAGGSISIRHEIDNGDGVLVKRGAAVDVSGGYRVDSKGIISGGDAGSLTVQGSSIVLAGELRGYSLVGNNGGSAILHGNEVKVSPSSPALPPDFEVASVLPDSIKGQFTLAADDFKETGFTQLELRSVNDLIIQAGVQWSPSQVKLAQPTARKASLGTFVANHLQRPGDTSITDEGLLKGVAPEWLGSTAIRAKAGVLFPSAPLDAVANTGARLEVAGDTLLSVAPAGRVSLEGPQVEFAGTIRAPSGTVALKASLHDLAVSGNARIEADGINRPESGALVKGATTGFRPLAGGTVTLEANNGNLILGQDTRISVTGSSPIGTLLRAGAAGLSRVTEAGDAGSVLLSFSDRFQLDGELLGHAGMPRQMGGSLTITNKSVEKGLTLSGQDLGRYVTAGFDDLTLRSAKTLILAGTGSHSLGRRLTLDAPVIQGSGATTLSLSAPWITLTNSTFPSGANVTEGLTRLSLSSQWLEVSGAIQFSGFQQLDLGADRDIRLSDRFYTLGTTSLCQGQLETAGNLTCRADRIYPTTLADFTLRSGGKLTTLPRNGALERPVYSAGGKLTLEAAHIEHRGFLAAPAGELLLRSTGSQGRTFLAEGSVISVAGSKAVNYGDRSTLYWTVPDKVSRLPVNVETAPLGAVSLEGSEVIVKDGAQIDISGGGSVFGYQFLAGIDGSTDPLTKPGTFVILPSDPLALPGTTIYLSGVPDLAPGFYSLLPTEYAFLPGAMIVADLGRTNLSGQWRTAEGYAVASGHAVTAGTDLATQGLQAYSVRSASDVLKEGNFNLTQLPTGHAGSLTVTGTTSVLDGTIRAAFGAGFEGGRIALSGEEIMVKSQQTSLPPDFSFTTPLPDDYRRTLQVNSESLSGMGLQSIELGTLGTTRSIAIERQSVLEAGRITLAASREIRMGEKAELRGLALSGGELVLLAPNGKATLDQGSLLHAGSAITFEVGQIDLKGSVRIDEGVLNLTADRILLSPSGTLPMASGSAISQDLWNVFGSFADVRLTGRSELAFLGDFDLNTQGRLTLNTPRIAALEETGGGLTTLAIVAETLHMLNTWSDPGTISPGSLGTLTARAGRINLGSGNILLDGLGSASLTAANDMVLQGSGSLVVGHDLTLTAARLMSSGYRDDSGGYQASNYRIQAANGTLALARSGGSAGQDAASGGRLEMMAQSIEHSGRIEIGPGQLHLTALGEGQDSGVFVGEGAEILARGNDHAAGGRLSLSAEKGVVSIAANALMDVSAGGQGDAGWISLSSPTNRLTLAGTLKGLAQDGSGGSFSADVGLLDQFSSFNSTLTAGGFTGAVALRARQGDVAITREDEVRTGSFKLIVDGGRIEVAGTIDTSNQGLGGAVELHAGSDLALLASGHIKARGTDGGGSVLLGTTGGRLSLDGEIDVSGTGSASGGTVTLRSAVEADDLKLDLGGSILGAQRVTAEAVVVDIRRGNLVVGETQLAKWQKQIQDFMQHEATVRERLLQGLDWDRSSGGELTLSPGLEVQATGKLSLETDWDLTSWRSGNAVGTLTLRAGGDLSVNASLVDHPTLLSALPGSAGGDSWSFSLVAGSDLASADPLATLMGKGNLSLAGGKMVYTESGSLTFASGADTLIGPSGSTGYMVKESIRYSLGTYDGMIRGAVGGNLEISGGAIQSALGDIHLKIGGDLLLKKVQDFVATADSFSLGSIRTTGEPAEGVSGLSNFWNYRNGGDIGIEAGGTIRGNLAAEAWDHAYGTRAPRRWAASYEGTNAAEGLITMGGGDLRVRVGGDFFCQAGTFGKGNLSIQAGGDLKGRFLVKEGSANLVTGGSFGSLSQKQVIEVFDARIGVTAQGDIHLGAVVNPTIARAPFDGEWNLQYSPGSSVSLVSAAGDVWLYGDSDFYDLGTSQARLERVMPPSLFVSAPGSLYLQNELALVPSSTGGLTLLAGKDIDGAYMVSMLGSAVVNRASINLSDLDPGRVYGYRPGFAAADLFSRYQHADNPVHREDSLPVSVTAGRDLKNLQLVLSKPARLAANRDIIDLYYFGQNLRSDDLTSVKAGRDILFSSSSNLNFDTGLEQNGPGWFMVQAGRSIDLGTSKGIQSVSNTLNPALPSDAVFLAISAGFQEEVTGAAVASFFEELRAAGLAYSRLQSEGRSEEAREYIDAFRTTLEDTVFGHKAAFQNGNIDMTSSQINTAGSGSLFLAVAGDLNVGRSSFFASEGARRSTGVFTSAGGAINIFAGGDVNVNESRVMSYRGGDITVWSDHGNINAGRGSKTAINVSPPHRKWVKGVLVVEFEPPSMGSGIRALTYDPDGVEGALPAPPAGDIYLFAPQGIIDAGEAGISGGNVILGATEVRNVANISFASGSVGVPAASEGSASLGALTGLSSVTQELKADSAASLPASRTMVNQGETAAEQFATNWLEVKVIGFDSETEEEEFKKN